MLLVISVTGHTALAVKLARPSPSVARMAAQSVSIEIEPPPIIEPPRPEPPRETPRLVATPRRIAAPRPRFAPPPPVERPPESEEPQEAPPPVETPAPPPVESGPPGPPTPALPPPPPPVVKPQPVVAAHEGANYLKNPRPPYPDVAMRRDWQGEVLLRVRVAPNGRVETVAVQRSSGHDVLDEAAISAVRDWSFVPSRQGGVAIAGWVSVPVVFRLQQGS